MFRKISVKLIIAVSLTSLIIIGVFSYFNLKTQSKVLTDEVAWHAIQLSETIKKSMHLDMLANNREHMHKIIKIIGKEPCIKKVRIFNKEGEIIYSADTTDIGEMVDVEAESCYRCHKEDEPLERLEQKDRTRIYRLHPDSSRVLGVINPIYNEPSCYNADCHEHPEDQSVLGVLDITLCLKRADQALERSEVYTFLFAVISILTIGIIISIFVKKWIDKPVQELVEATKRVAVGNLNQPIKYDKNDELGILAKSFNNMMKKLSEMRVQLFQSDKLASLGRLAAGVAHEINNPLTGVLTYSSYLLKRTKDNPELQKDLEVIVRETKRSREIVKGLLDFARQSTPKKNKFDVNEVIEKAISVISNQLKIHKIKLIKNLSPYIPQITGDANQIQQVILNLIVNAIDAIGEKSGTISITTEKISLVPYGIKQIKNATCPKGHNLMDEDHKIDGMPSIKLRAKSKTSEGFIHLDPIYGRHQHHFGIDFSKEEIIQLYCPVCGISLIDESEECPECIAPVYKIIIPNQGTLVGCAKYGCKWQKWEYIDAKGKQDYVVIKVSDTGCGIPENIMDKIFEPFFTTKGQKGTGLGLSIIWGIIDNHNGKISVASKVGEGTTFTIQLPANELN